MTVARQGKQAPHYSKTKETDFKMSSGVCAFLNYKITLNGEFYQ